MNTRRSSIRDITVGIFSVVALAGAASGCAGKPDGGQPTDAPATAEPAAASAPAGDPRVDPSLLSRELLFGNPDKVGPAISSDGQRVLYLAPVDGVMNVWVADIGALESAKPVTQDTLRGVPFAIWSRGGDRVLYVQDRGGDENFHVYAADPSTGESRDLTPVEGVQAHIVEASRDFPDEILVALNDRDPAYHDVYRVNVKTGARELVLKNEDGYTGFVFDDAYKPRIALRATDDGGMQWLVRKGKRFKPLTTIGKDDMLETTAYGFDRAGETLYMSDSRGRETGALVALNLKSGRQRVLAEDPQVGVSAWLSDVHTHRPLAVAFDRERTRWQLLDDAVKADFAYLETVRPDDFIVLGQTLDDQTWLVLYRADDGPARYYVYDRADKQARLLFSSRAALEDKPLAPMHPVVIPSRDGLELVSYLSVPTRSDPDSDGRPDAPLPMVLLVHGGPWGRVRWGYDATHQWLTSRGYAVLDVNFRGSTGFTKSFANAGDGEWAGKMHDDLLDAVRWAVTQNIAREDKVAIMGASYGGYATLVGLTFTPEVFACGVDIVGPSNLLTLLQTIPPYWDSLRATFAQRVGDPETEEGRAQLLARSPIAKVDQIKRPLLIGQGANDPRVKRAESDQIVKAMQERGIPVTYALYPDEGHGFRRPENKKSFNAVAEAFLSECLGGVYEPIGDDLAGSSVTVPVGAEHVPGLAEALARR